MSEIRKKMFKRRWSSCLDEYDIEHTLVKIYPGRGNIVNNTTCLEKMLYYKNETTCFGLYWPTSSFYNI
jgi:hypothetical protein